MCHHEVSIFLYMQWWCDLYFYICIRWAMMILLFSICVSVWNFCRSAVTMATRGLVLMALVATVVGQAAKQGNVDFIGEWNFPSLPSLSKQIHNFISGKSSTQYLRPVNDKSKASLSARPRGKQFSPIQPPVPHPAPTFSIHGNSQYLDYPKSRNLKIVPRVKARERIFIRSQLNPDPTSNGPTPKWVPAIPVRAEYHHPPSAGRSVHYNNPPPQNTPRQRGFPRPPPPNQPATPPRGQPAPHQPSSRPTHPSFAYTVPSEQHPPAQPSAQVSYSVSHNSKPGK